MDSVYFIGIGGGSASGKSTVAGRLARLLGTDKSSIINLDSYYNDLTGLSAVEREKINFDHPDAIDLNLLQKHLKQLSSGIPIQKPLYDFTTHTRKSKCEEFFPSEFIILDGLFSLALKNIRTLLSYKIYVNVSDDLRLIRRILRDINERGRNIDDIIKQYLNSVKKMHDEIIEPSKKYADIIIDWDDYNSSSIVSIAEYIKSTKKGTG